MFSSLSSVSRLLGALAIVVAPAKPDIEWLPIEPEHLAVAEPRIDPEADAEALRWEVRIDDDRSRTRPRRTLWRYVRIKVFNQRGAEEHSTVEIIAADKRTKIEDIGARTVKADGSVIDLDSELVFESDLLRARKVQVGKYSFTLPQVEPGDIIEYQWRETRELSQYQRLYVQQDIPVWRVRYLISTSINPLREDMVAGIHHLNFEVLPFRWEDNEEEGDSEFSLERASPRTIAFEARDLPALEREPYMPPVDTVRGWFLLFYAPAPRPGRGTYWSNYGIEAAREIEGLLKTSGRAVKKKAEELTRGLTTVPEKILAIRRFCLESVRNVAHSRYGVAAEERAEVEDSRKLSDVLDHGYATADQTNYLFVSLLRAAGIRAHLALMSRRDDFFFEPRYRTPYFFNGTTAAVDLGDRAAFFDLSAPYAENGMLRWYHEGVMALILDPDNPRFARTAFSGPQQSVTRRKGDFELHADGALVGEVVVEHRGHPNREAKLRYGSMTTEQRAEALTEEIRETYPNAEVSDVHFSNAKAIDESLAYSYRIRAPNYAVRTGERLFLQPSFFHSGDSPIFPSSAERVHDIYFEYAWSELDAVTIRLPDGYELEEAEAPGAIKLGDVGSYRVQMGTNDAGRTLVYTRSFEFGKQGGVYFPAESYPQLKRAFDLTHRQDGHTMALTGPAGDTE